MLPANAVRGVVATGGSRANIDRTDVCDSSLYVLRISETPTPGVKRRRGTRCLTAITLKSQPPVH